MIREAHLCPFPPLEQPCPHYEHIHDRVRYVFSEPEIFDPLKLQPENKWAYAAMVGAVALTLSESVTRLML